PSNATSVFLDIDAAGDFSAGSSSEYFTVSFDGVPWGGNMTANYQDCNLHSIVSNQDVTSLFTPGSTVQVTVISGPGVHDLGCWPNDPSGMIADLTFNFTGQATSACDSTATLNLTINNCGCTDPLACNYDSLATVDDTSCIYPTTSTLVVDTCMTSYTWAANGTTYTQPGIYIHNGVGNVGPTTQTFSYTGSMQNYTVPAGVTSITIDAYGAQGGNNPQYDGGKGAHMSGTFSVTPGQVLDIIVGGQGSPGFTNSGWTGGGGGGGTGVISSALPLVIAGAG
ncbi:uncharacterized protein METZ01_LOCUS404442, partial [marine metagenome]